MEADAAGSVGDLILQLGVGGVFALLVIRTVLDFLSKQREKKSNGNGSSSTAMSDLFALNRDILANVEDLHKWHDVKDEDQVPVWYVRKSLERLISQLSTSVDKMAEAVEDQTKAIQALVEAGE